MYVHANGQSGLWQFSANALFLVDAFTQLSCMGENENNKENISTSIRWCQLLNLKYAKQKMENNNCNA